RTPCLHIRRRRRTYNGCSRVSAVPSGRNRRSSADLKEVVRVLVDAERADCRMDLAKPEQELSSVSANTTEDREAMPCDCCCAIQKKNPFSAESGGWRSWLEEH